MVYGYTEELPSIEQFGLKVQMRRSVVSIPSNIAEGRGRGTRKDFCYFLRIALGSCNELETQLELSKRIYKIDLNNKDIKLLLTEVVKMLKTFIKKLNV